jgi:putative flippase GtrA
LAEFGEPASQILEVAPLNKTVLPAASNRRAVVAQIFRYGVSGGAAALLYSVIYWELASGLTVKPIVANVVAWLASLVSSYALHSRWSFREQVHDPGSRQAMIRFLCINFAGLALNSLWVWLIVDVMKFDVRAPLIPVLLITPWFTFYACRRWAFR